MLDIKTLNQLDKYLCPTTVGVLIQQNESIQKSKYFNAFNYIFDGLLIQSIKERPKKRKISFFSTKSFNYEFFLIFFSCNKNSSQLLNGIEIIANNSSKNKNEVLYLNESRSDSFIPPDWSKSFGQLYFKKP